MRPKRYVYLSSISKLYFRRIDDLIDESKAIEKAFWIEKMDLYYGMGVYYYTVV